MSVNQWKGKDYLSVKLNPLKVLIFCYTVYNYLYSVRIGITLCNLLFPIETNGATLVTLSGKDIVNLVRLLQSYSYKWNPIGLSLGFTPHELCTISSKVTLLTGAPVSYLQELLSQWVQWPTTDHPSDPTVRVLCTALRSSLVGLGSLAEMVEKEMKQCATGKNEVLNYRYVRIFGAMLISSSVLGRGHNISMLRLGGWKVPLEN